MTDADVSPIAEAKRQLTLERIRRAALVLLMQRGLDITMDDIADAAGIGRRTLFRHFDSRDHLLAAALDEGIQRSGERLPAFRGDWPSWLRALCDHLHEMQASYGPGYLDLMHRTDLPAELAAVETDRRARRRRAMKRIAETLWREAGGKGTPPPAIVAVVIGHLSPRFTAAIMDDAGQPWNVAADLAYDAISAALGAVAAANPAARARHRAVG